MLPPLLSLFSSLFLFPFWGGGGGGGWGGGRELELPPLDETLLEFCPGCLLICGLF